MRKFLTFKDKASTNLVAGFIQFLGVEGETHTKGESRVDLGIVGYGSDTLVVNLGLHSR